MLIEKSPSQMDKYCMTPPIMWYLEAVNFLEIESRIVIAGHWGVWSWEGGVSA